MKVWKNISIAPHFGMFCPTSQVNAFISASHIVLPEFLPVKAYCRHVTPRQPIQRYTLRCPCVACDPLKHEVPPTLWRFLVVLDRSLESARVWARCEYFQSGETGEAAKPLTDSCVTVMAACVLSPANGTNAAQRILQDCALAKKIYKNVFFSTGVGFRALIGRSAL